ncbi:hypothetical protein [Phycicoccus avicenniae]|uniref:hypothetical protein n=1 Tax=Phycicoccus avicenniae TaxID=2828860 RepID=UPI003D29B7F6
MNEIQPAATPPRDLVDVVIQQLGDARDVPGSSGAHEVVYVDSAPRIPGHLGTTAAHVHVRGTDACLRRPDGVECLTPAELRLRLDALRHLAQERATALYIKRVVYPHEVLELLDPPVLDAPSTTKETNR